MLQVLKQFFRALIGAPRPVPCVAHRVEDLESRQMMAANYDLGININEGSTSTMVKAIPVLKKLGVKSVRLWVGISNFNNHSWAGNLQRAVDYSNAGFDVMVIVSSSGGKVTNPDAVRGWFKWAMGNSALKAAVDRWQISNEPDSYKYWQGSLSSYVNNFLKPASEVLRPAGETVVSAGPSWNPQDVKTMINAGMLNYVDYVGYHPYANGVSLMKQRVSELKSIVAGRKPLLASEWNVRGYEGDKTKWAEAVEDAFPVIRDNFAINYYFAVLNTTATKAGPGGIMNSSGTTTRFYDAIARAKGTSSGSGSDSSSGNTASSLPSVARVSVFNADTDKLVINSLVNGQTIDLKDFGTRNLAFVAVAGSGTSSVKFNFNGSTTIESNSPYSVFGEYTSSNLKGKTFSPGTYTLTAQGFSKDLALGTGGSKRSFTFTVKNTAGTSTPSSTTAPKVTAFKLINASTGAAIKGYEYIDSNESIKLSSLSTRNVRLVAITNSSTGSVKFTAFGKTIVENSSPYRTSTWYAKTGSYFVKAAAYSKDNAAGTLGNTLGFTLKFY